MPTNEQIKKYVEMEREVHPWASDDILERIVRDELKRDPDCYEEGEYAEDEHSEPDGDEGISIILNLGAPKREEKDPFEEESEDEETEEED